MKRYFLSHDDDMPTIKEPITGMNFIDLGTHGPAGYKWNLVCLEHDHVMPKDKWFHFPLLVDSKTTLAQSAIPQEVLADLGLTGEETTLEAVAIFGSIFPPVGL